MARASAGTLEPTGSSVSFVRMYSWVTEVLARSCSLNKSQPSRSIRRERDLRPAPGLRPLIPKAKATSFCRRSHGSTLTYRLALRPLPPACARLQIPQVAPCGRAHGGRHDPIDVRRCSVPLCTHGSRRRIHHPEHLRSGDQAHSHRSRSQGRRSCRSHKGAPLTCISFVHCPPPIPALTREYPLRASGFSPAWSTTGGVAGTRPGKLRES
jgi:hypothetical protein